MASALQESKVFEAVLAVLTPYGACSSPFEINMAKLIEQKLLIMRSKREMRGTTNIQRQGLVGVVNRLSEDKLERIKRMVADDSLAKELAKRQLKTVHEGTDLPAALPTLETAEQKLQLEDDLMDIANYCDICIMLLRGTWE